MENSFTLASTEAVENVKIVQSCNGLLLYTGPSAGLRMVFDLTKSLNYKVVHAGRTSSHTDIQTYCLEIGNWSLCRDWLNFFSFDHFDSAIYWNGALHWLEIENIQDGYLKHYKLNLEDHDHPILTTIQIHQGLHRVKMDDPNITMELYIQLKEEKARIQGKVYNWETATNGKIWCDENAHNLRSVETKFPAIVFNDALTSEVALSCEPTVSPLNDNQIDFRISFDESEDEDNTVNMPSFPSSEPKVSHFNDFDYFKDFEKEFPTIAYNDALMSNLDFLPEPTLSPQHIDEFN
ncbi:hypothetical protein Tco_0040441 [Tanacetum coccineum]